MDELEDGGKHPRDLEYSAVFTAIVFPNQNNHTSINLSPSSYFLPQHQDKMLRSFLTPRVATRSAFRQSRYVNCMVLLDFDPPGSPDAWDELYNLRQEYLQHC